jgi:hypothetical protein
MKNPMSKIVFGMAAATLSNRFQTGTSEMLFRMRWLQGDWDCDFPQTNQAAVVCSLDIDLA